MKKLIFTICLLGINMICFPQKYRPMMDDVLRLNELLHKDYSIVNMDLYDEEIMKDEQEVVNRLKAYLNITSLSITGRDSNTKFLIEKKRELLKANEKIDAIKTNLGKGTKSEISKDDIETCRNEINEIKKSIRDCNYLIVKHELDAIGNIISSKNNFLDTIINRFKIKYESLNNDVYDKYALPATNASSKKSLIGLGSAVNFDVIIGGLVNFIAKRFKEELANQLFDRLKKTLNNDSITEIAVLKTMLPRTHHFLVSIEEYNLPKLFNELKQNVEYDLNHLAEQMYNLKKVPDIRNEIKKDYQSELAFEGFWLYNQMLVMNNPVDLVSKIETMPVCQEWDKSKKSGDTAIIKYNIANSLKLISLLSNSLTVTNGESRAWMNVEDFKRNIKNENFYYLYFGLLLQQDRNYFNVKFRDKGTNLLSFNDSINKQFTTYNGVLKPKFELVLSEFIDAAENVNNQVTLVSKLKKQDIPISSDTIYNLLSACINVIDKAAAFGDSLVSLINPDSKVDFKSIQNYIGYARTGAEVYRELGNENYVMALMLVLEKLNSTFVKEIVSIDDQRISSLQKELKKAENQLDTITSHHSNNKMIFKKKNKKKAIKLLKKIPVILSDLDFENAATYSNQISSIQAELNDIKRYVNKLKLNHDAKKNWYECLKEINKNIPTSIISPKTHEVLNFVLGLATAKTDEEAAKVIEKAAVPAGSYSIKNKSKLTVSVNAYAGLFGTYEYRYNHNTYVRIDGNDTIHYEWKPNYGITAPVGISLNWGLPNKKSNLGLNLSIIDLGALVNFRLSDSAELPKFDYINIFSPGLHFVYSPFNNFITFSIGAQLGPNLISYKRSLEKYSTVRFDASIVVDIPVFYLYKKSRFLNK